MTAHTISVAEDRSAWDAFLLQQQFRPFLQSWAMGEVYRSIEQEPVRLELREGGAIRALCFAHLVSAKRGRHLSVPYGPVVGDARHIPVLLDALREEARKRDCAFVRLSPFWPVTSAFSTSGRPSPLHLLAEHLWYVPLEEPDFWRTGQRGVKRSEEAILKDMRSTARNLIRRAAKEGVEVSASADPVADLPHFLTLHDETRRRHGFTPYSDAFFRAQVEHFAPQKQVSLYLARYRGEVIAASIHMTFGGETSYHHGASSQKYRTIPASYLLQWTALREALLRGDHVYNFWGVSPEGATQHPFAGVRTFKTSFGGALLELQHCTDLPLSPRYHLTRAVETVRKWRRGF